MCSGIDLEARSNQYIASYRNFITVDEHASDVCGDIISNEDITSETIYKIIPHGDIYDYLPEKFLQ